MTLDDNPCSGMLAGASGRVKRAQLRDLQDRSGAMPGLLRFGLAAVLALGGCAASGVRRNLERQEDLGNGFYRYEALADDDRRLTLYANRPDLVEGAPRQTLVFVTGSGCTSAFRRRTDGTLSGGMGGLFARFGPPGLTVVILEKCGVEGFTPVDDRDPPRTEAYLRHGVTLRERTDRQAAMIRSLTRLPSVASGRVVLVGHSEGADVAAATAVLLGPARVSHLVFLAGGGGSQMFDAVVLARRHYADLAPAERERQVASLRAEMCAILEDPESVEEWQGEPKRRWASYFRHAPLDDLLALRDIPIFVGHGSEDPAVPVESADLIAVEFVRRNRREMTYRVYAGADHSFAGIERRLVTDIFEWILTTSGGSAVAATDTPSRLPEGTQGHEGGHQDSASLPRIPLPGDPSAPMPVSTSSREPTRSGTQPS